MNTGERHEGGGGGGKGRKIKLLPDKEHHFKIKQEAENSGEKPLNTNLNTRNQMSIMTCSSCALL